MKKTVIIVFLLIAFVPFYNAFGQKGKGKPGKENMKKMHNQTMCPMMHKHMPCMGMRMLGKDSLLKEIGVADNVRAKIREMIHAMHKNMMDTHFQINEINIKLKEEYKKATLDENEIASLNSKIIELCKNNMEQSQKTSLEIMKMLTADQRAKLLEHKMGMMKGKNKPMMKGKDKMKEME